MNGDDIESLSYEVALTELDGIIERLERGAVALDEAIAAYERGSRLAQHCGELLDRTEQKITQLVVGGGGLQAERPFDPERAERDPVAAAPVGRPAEAGLPFGSAAGGTPGPGAAEMGRSAAASPTRRDAVPIDPDDIPF